jgi:hypothetical protein
MNHRHLRLRLLTAGLAGVLVSILVLVVNPNTSKYLSEFGDSALAVATENAFHLITSFSFLVIYFASLLLFVAFRYRREDALPAAFMAGLTLVQLIRHLVSSR